MDNKLQGYTHAIISAASFGLIPLFSIPVLEEGMPLPSALIYRFVFGCLSLLAILVFKHEKIRISYGDTLRILFLSFLYCMSAVCLFSGYNYMPSGIATTLLFSYPIWTAILMMIFFKERLTLRTTIAILLAVAGVALLSGINGNNGNTSFVGVLLELSAGLIYAIYMVSYPHLRIRQMSSLKLTVYVFFFSAIILSLYSMFTTGNIGTIQSPKMLLNLFLLGLIPTAISNITLIMALKKISSTLVAILGAVEPLTAMAIGILVFGEAFTMTIAIGILLTIISVIVLITAKEKPKDSKSA